MARRMPQTTYDHELTLIQQQTVEDEIGNQRVQDVPKDVLCRLSSIGRNEFYSAATANLRPDITFIVHAYEYEGERKVKYNGQQYSVIRTYSTGFEEIELTCERSGADG